MSNLEDNTRKRTHLDAELTPPDQLREIDMSDLMSAVNEDSDMPGLRNALFAVLRQCGIDNYRKDMIELKKSLNNAQTVAEESKKLANKNKLEIESLRTELGNVKAQLQAEKDARLRNECQSRRSNLRIYGVKEAEGETVHQVEETVQCIFNQKLRISEDIHIERCHRLGPKSDISDSKPRPIIIKFSFFKQRDLVWSRKKELKGESIFIKEDFPPEIEARRNTLLPVYLAALKLPDSERPRVNLVMDRLYIGSDMYTVETIRNLPSHLQPENLSTKSNETAVWFWRRESPFSNHYKCSFSEAGVSYNCTEQYLMAHKAKLFGDNEAEQKIMASDNPVFQKQTKVRNFNREMWRNAAPEIMKKCLLLKFDQNEQLKDKLLSTGSKVIGEAAPKDDFWGCGLAINNPLVCDPTNWKGRNVLGKLLVEVRNELR